MAPCRSILVIMVLLAMGGVAVVEQPGTSILPEHVAFKRLVALLRVRKIPAARLCWRDLLDLV